LSISWRSPLVEPMAAGRGECQDDALRLAD
jgi:hypothetical protein